MRQFSVVTNGTVGTVYIGNSFEEAIAMYKSWCRFITKERSHTTIVELLEGFTTISEYSVCPEEKENVD